MPPHPLGNIPRPSPIKRLISPSPEKKNWVHSYSLLNVDFFPDTTLVFTNICIHLHILDPTEGLGQFPIVLILANPILQMRTPMFVKPCVQVAESVFELGAVSLYILRSLCSTARVLDAQSFPSTQRCMVLEYKPTLCPASRKSSQKSYSSIVWSWQPQEGQETARPETLHFTHHESSISNAPLICLSPENMTWINQRVHRLPGVSRVLFLTFLLGDVHSPSLPPPNDLTGRDVPAMSP